jgi:glucose/arabinose dehydrogenase
MLRRALLTTFAIAMSATAARADYGFQDAFPLLPTFTEPLAVQDPFDGTDRLFVLEKQGTIRVFANDPGASNAPVFLDLADSVTNVWESGALDVVFHPNYESNGYFYVTYITKDPLRWRLSRFHVSANPNVADPNSELTILEVPETNLYHKGGCLVFDANGDLFVSIGDDGWHTDAQDRSKIKGKLLHIDVDHPAGGKNYGIPANNPYAGNTQGYLEEVWAYGFRNPWRFSIDAPTGRIWLGDVGENVWEEINIVKKGRNYGWSAVEGPDCWYPPECDTVGLNIDMPLHAYAHTSEYGGSVIGGIVYRGTRIPSLNGFYIYADNSAGEAWGLVWNGVAPPTNYLLNVPPEPQTYRFDDISADKDKELFFSSFINGRIWQMVLVPSGVGDKGTPAMGSLMVHPNPFAGEARIRYDAPAASSVEVYDVHGRLVRRIAGDVKGQGEITWDGRNSAGAASASGVYFVRMTHHGRSIASQRVVLLK